MGDVQLGYCVPFEDATHWKQGSLRSVDWKNDWDGGQSGGTPVWLDPEHLPQPLSCRHCHLTVHGGSNGNNSDNGKNGNGSHETREGSMHFVCQLYAPQETKHAFHRTLYVFACPTCTGPESIRVLRIQLPKVNPYWPLLETSDDNGSPKVWKKHLPSMYHTHGVCVVCAFPAKGRCPLQQQSFCGRAHQRLYKKHATIRASESSEPYDDTETTWMRHTKSTLPGVYNAREIVVEAEPELPDTTESPDGNPAQHETLFPDQGDTDEHDSDEDMEQEDLNEILTGRKDSSTVSLKRLNDAVYQRFTDRITERPHAKDQVLRYNCTWPTTVTADNADETTATSLRSPLWIRHDHQPSHESIPSCPYCGSERQFEFQLMPQLLHYLTNQSKVSNNVTGGTAGAQSEYTSTVAALQQTESFLQQAPPESVSPQLVESRNAALERMRQTLLTSSSDQPRLNWGVVTVYTCVESCSGDSSALDSTPLDTSLGAYREEFAWVQPSIDSLQ